MSQHNVKVQRWLDEADAAMSGDSESRRDVLMELQSAIMDRVDERTDKSAKPDEALDTVLQDMGDPAEVGSSFLPAPILIGSHQTRPFMINTALLNVRLPASSARSDLAPASRMPSVTGPSARWRCAGSS